MDDESWANALLSLTLAAERFRVLARCLAVAPQLGAWRDDWDEFSANSAVDALDQACGGLERLASGEAADLLRIVEALLEELPAPLE